VRSVVAKSDHTRNWIVSGSLAGVSSFETTSKFVCVCTNRRLGLPRELTFAHEDQFAGTICRGLGDDTRSLDWANKQVAVIGMGAYAAELLRTALEREQGALNVTILARHLTTVLPRSLDWLIYIRPWDKDSLETRPAAGGIATLQIMVDSYAMIGLTRPRQFKPDGGIALSSDLFYSGHHLAMVEAIHGEVAHVEPEGIMTDAEPARFVVADILIKCVGFHPNTTTENIIGTSTMTGIGLVEPNLWVKGEPHVDNGPDTSNRPLATSIFYSVPFFCNVVLHYWHRPTQMAEVMTSDMPRVNINHFTLSEWVQSYRHLRTFDEQVDAVFREYVSSVRERCLAISTIEEYLAANALEWELSNRLLLTRKRAQKAPLPYPFERPILQLLYEDDPQLLSEESKRSSRAVKSRMELRPRVMLLHAALLTQLLLGCPDQSVRAASWSRLFGRVTTYSHRMRLLSTRMRPYSRRALTRSLRRSYLRS
jgi:mRNA-degrading endonuclease toxin of MazEF toxin-antitoxin module